MGLPTIRPEGEVYKAHLLLRAMQRTDIELFPLGIRSKMPRDKGFLTYDYGKMVWAKWLTKYGNVGVRARATDLIIDVDPKNGGLASWDTLQWDTDLLMDGYPITKTGRGNGGFHLYMAKPPEMRLRWHVKTLPGIDFQTFGRYVVAPGSIHPDTGLPYTMTEWHEPEDAPAALLKMLEKPARKPPGSTIGKLTVPEVEHLLALLDAHDFGGDGKHADEWLDIAMACHHATNGEGVDAWLTWCATDENYGEEASALNLARWDSFDDGRVDGVTYRTLLQAVVRAGHAKEVARLHVEDFEGPSAAETFADMDMTDVDSFIESLGD